MNDNDPAKPNSALPKAPKPSTEPLKAPTPPQVHSGEPELELERKLKLQPHNLDAKADVGSDQSMDASDPPAASQPGQNDEPVPSSSFPG